MKYVLVSGGVVSGLGKGVTASSIGVILKNCGHRVTSVKIGQPAACVLLSARQLAFSSLLTVSCYCRPLLEHRCWDHVTI